MQMGFVCIPAPTYNESAPDRKTHMIRTPAIILFDIFGTLCDTTGLTVACEERFPGQGGELYARWLTRQREYGWQRSLMRRYVDHTSVSRAALIWAAESLDLSFSEADLGALLQAWQRLPAYPDASSALSALEKHHGMATLSDASLAVAEAALRANGLAQYFMAHLSADAVQCFRPDPRVYEHARARFGVDAEEIAYISAHCGDVAGAKTFGFTGIWLNREAQPADHLGVAPDAIIRSLNALTTLLPAPEENDTD